MTSYYRERLAGQRLRRCYEIASPRVRRYLGAEIEHIRDRILPGSEVLELGCGYGRVLERLTDLSTLLVGIDTARDSLALGRSTLPQCAFSEMDARRLAFRDGSFDAVLCAQNGICAFGVDQKRLVAEAIRVLRPLGVAFFSTYTDSFWNYRLEWFEAQAREGLVGPIDYAASKDGLVVCRDGFRAGRMTPEDLRGLMSSLGLSSTITEVDESSIICEVRRARTA